MQRAQGRWLHHATYGAQKPSLEAEKVTDPLPNRAVISTTRQVGPRGPRSGRAAGTVAPRALEQLGIECRMRAFSIASGGPEISARIALPDLLRVFRPSPALVDAAQGGSGALPARRSPPGPHDGCRFLLVAFPARGATHRSRIWSRSSKA